jgi:hypothetical protein
MIEQSRNLEFLITLQLPGQPHEKLICCLLLPVVATAIAFLGVGTMIEPPAIAQTND